MVVGKVASLPMRTSGVRGALLRVHGLETPSLSFNSLWQKEPASRFA